MRNWGYDAAEARGVLVREIDEYNIDGSLRDKGGANQPVSPVTIIIKCGRLTIAAGMDVL
jgi:hypothetical protein